MRVRSTYTRLIFTIGVACCAAAALAQEKAAEAVRPLRSDSRAQYVHRITLYDASGGAIDPTKPDAPPYSPRATCGKCHEVGSIAHGWHFNANAGGPSGRIGEPWIVTDGAAGVQAPVSYRDWPSVFKPESLGLSDWDFTLRFGRQLPGGGVAAPDKSGAGERWGISGGLEIDCLICHSADQRHDPAEVERQIERENLRWSPTAAYGLATVRGDAKKLPEDFDPDAPPNPDYPDLIPPKTSYNRFLFDGDNRVFFNITRRPQADRCEFCHTTRAVNEHETGDWHSSRDVHMAAGMNCVDCHRNGIDHMIVRGYEGEAAARPDPGLVAFSCAGCHLGERDAPLARKLDAPLSARQAPRPEHRGLPPIHFEKLTCTACHSGPWPGAFTLTTQTAFAHGLGVPSRERSPQSAPEIVSPVFLRDVQGKIAPHRLLWPAYWAVEKDDQLLPIPISTVRRALGLKANAEFEPLAEFSDAELITAIQKLAPAAKNGGEVVRVANGQIYRVTSDQKIVASSHALAAPVAWPLGHDVRPARQALGIRGCTDCHANNAPIFAGAVASSAKNTHSPQKTMSELRCDDVRFAATFNQAIAGREVFKLAGLAGLAVISLAALQRLFAALDACNGVKS